MHLIQGKLEIIEIVFSCKVSAICSTNLQTFCLVLPNAFLGAVKILLKLNIVIFRGHRILKDGGAVSLDLPIFSFFHRPSTFSWCYAGPQEPHGGLSPPNLGICNLQLLRSWSAGSHTFKTHSILFHTFKSQFNWLLHTLCCKTLGTIHDDKALLLGTPCMKNIPPSFLIYQMSLQFCLNWGRSLAIYFWKRAMTLPSLPISSKVFYRRFWSLATWLPKRIVKPY